MVQFFELVEAKKLGNLRNIMYRKYQFYTKLNTTIKLKKITITTDKYIDFFFLEVKY